jgi:hypothetical protein
MRDYKGSGRMTLRRRRRSPSGPIILTVLVITGLVAAYFLWGQGMLSGSDLWPGDSTRKDGIIPLEIPGQQPGSEQGSED